MDPISRWLFTALVAITAVSLLWVVATGRLGAFVESLPRPPPPARSSNRWSPGRSPPVRWPGGPPVGERASIRTPNGPAWQGSAGAEVVARARVTAGATLYRIGTLLRSHAAGAQYWALEAPDLAGFAKRYGIPAENVEVPDLVLTATLKPGGRFITRFAPGVGEHAGGGVEVVVEPDDVVMKAFHMRDTP